MSYRLQTLSWTVGWRRWLGYRIAGWAVGTAGEWDVSHVGGRDCGRADTWVGGWVPL